jgi:galactokinase
VAALRDLSLRQLEAGAAGLDPVALRRARHVVSENERTLAAAHALASGDMRLLGRLMAASHASMRDDFEITLPPIDELAALLTHVIGQQGGARMTGGGFGGCVVALLPQALVTEAQDAIAKHYRAPGGASAAMFVCQASAGATGAHWP